MSEIDEATGLPVLPDGYFWRVRDYTVEIRRNLPPGPWYRESYYGEPQTSGDFEKRVRTVGRRWPRKPLIEVESRVVNRSEAVWAVAGEVVTRDNLLSLARSALADWEDALAREALLGDYPPKRFEGEQ